MVGAGAVGGFFGGMLARAGAEVTLIGRPAHVDVWRREGLTIDSINFQARIPVGASTAMDACRDADVVVSILPKVADHLQAHGLDLRKLHVVPNGVDPDEWRGEPAPLDAALAAHIGALHAVGRLVVVYAGSHGEPNALDVTAVCSVPLVTVTPPVRLLVPERIVVPEVPERSSDSTPVPFIKILPVTTVVPVPVKFNFAAALFELEL